MYQGEGNVKLRLQIDNPAINISTWTCTMIITKPDGTNQTYTLTPSSDGTEATYITTGTEFPVAGQYTIQLNALAPGATSPNKSRVKINVAAAN